MSRIAEIIIPDSICDHFHSNTIFNSIEGIKRLNAFVGPNNSGKSRLLRSLYSASSRLKVSHNSSIETSLRKSARKVAAGLSAVQTNGECEGSRTRQETLEWGLNVFQNCEFGFSPISTLKHPADSKKKIDQFLEKWQDLSRDLRGIDSVRRLLTTANQIRLDLRNLEKAASKNSTELNPLSSSQFVYIPTLRGLRIPNDRNDPTFVC